MPRVPAGTSAAWRPERYAPTGRSIGALRSTDRHRTRDECASAQHLEDLPEVRQTVRQLGDPRRPSAPRRVAKCRILRTPRISPDLSGRPYPALGAEGRRFKSDRPDQSYAIHGANSAKPDRVSTQHCIERRDRLSLRYRKCVCTAVHGHRSRCVAEPRRHCLHVDALVQELPHCAGPSPLLGAAPCQLE